MQNKYFLEDFIISEDDFNYLKDLYKFTYLKDIKSYYDKKHNKIVASLSKNLFTNQNDIHFNKNWLAYEIIITKDKKLIEIFSRYIENDAKYQQIKQILDKMEENDRHYIQSFSEHNYNPTNDEIEHYKLSQYETLITTLQELL